MSHFGVVGGGLVGGLLAAVLTQKEHKVVLFEKRSDPRLLDYEGGRSINLALSHRGLKALDLIGIKEDALSISVPMYGRAIHNIKGEVSFQNYHVDKKAIYSISRAQLNKLLLDQADKSGVELLFNSPIKAVDVNSATIKSDKDYSFDYIVGADGAFSKVREVMMHNGLFNYSQEYLSHCYKELEIPSVNGEYAMDPNALHIWPRNKFMLIALPNSDGSFTATLFLSNNSEDISFSELNNDKKLETFFKTWFKDVFPLIPNLKNDFFTNPTGKLQTIKCSPWNSGRSMVIGDAAHAIVPFYGQGMNAGFEDVFLFNELLEEKYNVDDVFDTFYNQRKKDTDAIAELALHNFIEMRDHTGDPLFLLRKKIEQKVFKHYPNEWVPLYTMVTFTDIPYAEALEISKRQSLIMDEVMKDNNIEETWDDSCVIERIIERNRFLIEG